MVTIYVRLVGEGVDVWRPVLANEGPDRTYLIDPNSAVPRDEQWEFQPGERVRCCDMLLTGRNVLVAVASA
ncbi:MAG: hypothetical protein AMXMBFR47_11410 [Planctomycetota bacterium]